MQIPIEIVVVILGFFTTLIIGFIKVVIDNTKSNNNINITLAKIETRLDLEDKKNAEEHGYIKTKLAKHTENLENHEKRIIKLEK